MNAVSRSLSFRRPSGFTETFTESMLARASLKSTKKARLSHSKDFTFHWCWKVSVCCIRKERKPEADFWTSLYSPSLIMYISKMRNCSGRTWKGVSLEILYSASLRSETLWELLPQHARTERSSKKWFFISNDSIRHPNLPQSSRIFCAVPSLVLIYIFAHYWRIHDTQKRKEKKKRILFCCCCCFTFSSKLNWHASWLGSFISLRTRCLRRNSEQQRWKILSRDVIEDVHWALLLSSLFPSFFPFCLKPRDVVEQRLCQTGSLF